MAAAGLGERHDVTPGVYNVGSGRATSFNQMLEAIREALGLRAGQLPTEYFEMPASVREFYQDYTCADLSVTDWGLGWLPRRKPVEAIREYAGYLKQNPVALGTATATGGSGAGSGAAGESGAPANAASNPQRPGAPGRDG